MPQDWTEYYIYSSFRSALVVQEIRFRTPRQRRGTTSNLGSTGAERQPGGPCWCPVGASRRRAGPQILSHRLLFRNCAWPGPARLLRRAGPRQGRPAWRAGGTDVSGRAKLIGVLRRRNASFSGLRDLAGGRFQKTVKNIVFSVIQT